MDRCPRVWEPRLPNRAGSGGTSWSDTATLKVSQILLDMYDVLSFVSVQTCAVVRMRDGHVDRQRSHWVVLRVMWAVRRGCCDAGVVADSMPLGGGVARRLANAHPDDDQGEHNTLRRARRSILR